MTGSGRYALIEAYRSDADDEKGEGDWKKLPAWQVALICLAGLAVVVFFFWLTMVPGGKGKNALNWYFNFRGLF